jgi:hypothetical protein
MEGCVMFELISAVTMVAGLQAAPEQIKAERIFHLYEWAAMVPKELRIEFTKELMVRGNEKKEKYQGVFVLQRADKTSFRVRLSQELLEKKTTTDELGEFGTDILVAESRQKRMRIIHCDEGWSKWYRDKLRYTQFPFSNLARLKADYRITIVKDVDDYSYVEFEYAKNKREWFPPPQRMRVVFLRTAGNRLPIGAIRQVVLFNGEATCINVSKWEMNNSKDSRLFPVRRPILPDGWELQEHELKSPQFPNVPIRNPNP